MFLIRPLNLIVGGSFVVRGFGTCFPDCIFVYLDGFVN